MRTSLPNEVVNYRDPKNIRLREYAPKDGDEPDLSSKLVDTQSANDLSEACLLAGMTVPTRRDAGRPRAAQEAGPLLERATTCAAGCVHIGDDVGQAGPRRAPGRGLPDHTLRIDRLGFIWHLIAGLTNDDLEELVLELVTPEHPSALKLTAPHDHGLDVIVPARDGRRVIGWQAKNYRKRIYWTQCENSVRRAMDHWDPISITFVFPRPLTTSEIEDWEKFRSKMLAEFPRLKHLELCHAFARALRDRQDVLERMLQELLPGVDVGPLAAQATQGSSVASLDDMLDTAIQQAERDAALDEAFDAEVIRGPSRAPDKGEVGYSVELDHLQRPVLSFTWDDGDQRAKVTAVPRPNRNDNRVRPWFSESIEGRNALEVSRRELAHGRPVTFRGDHVGVQVDRRPRFFDSVEPKRDLVGGQLELEVSDSFPVTVTIVDGDDEQALTVDVVLVPPMPGYRHAVAGVHAGVMFTLDWLPGEPGRSQTAAKVDPVGVPAAELVGGLRFAQRFPDADLIRVDAPELFEKPILDRGATGAADTEETIEVALVIAQVAARLELLTGRTISLPGVLYSADLHAAQLLALVLDGDYEVTVPPDGALLLPTGSPTVPREYAGAVTRVPVVLFGVATGLELEWRFEGGLVTEVHERADGVAVRVTGVRDGPARAICGLRENREAPGAS